MIKVVSNPTSWVCTIGIWFIQLCFFEYEAAGGHVEVSIMFFRRYELKIGVSRWDQN